MMVGKDMKKIQTLLATYQSFGKAAWRDVTDTRIKEMKQALRALVKFLDQCG